MATFRSANITNASTDQLKGGCYLLCDPMHFMRQRDKSLSVEVLLPQLNHGHAAQDRVFDRLNKCSGGVVQPRVCDQIERVVDDGPGHDGRDRGKARREGEGEEGKEEWCLYEGMRLREKRE